MSNPTLAEIAHGVLNDVFNNIIHSTVIHQHRNHKMMLCTLDPTTKLPHCDRCHLPRLLDPPLAPKVRGAAAEPPKDTTYCDRKPWCRTPGFDIYGNPFPRADVTGRPPTKKEREAAKKDGNKKGDGDNTPASNEGGEANGTAPPSPSADGDAQGERKVEKGEKKASKIDEKLKKGEYVPWQTCPSCKRSLLVTRFAKHLEQCMGLSGRAASRNAMVKMGANTPAGSRGGTPGPNGQDNEEGEVDEGSVGGGGVGEVRKKALKKAQKEKMKKDKDKNGKAAKAGAAAAKRPPGSTSGEGKRDRDEMLEDGDDDGDVVHVKKRQKLQRVGSTASLGSQSVVGALEKRSESGDGSFVDEGGFDGED